MGPGNKHSTLINIQLVMTHDDTKLNHFCTILKKITDLKNLQKE